ncbi:MAG: hypothetical protein U0T73_04305 [Chitinophagales bacterium]
MTEYSGNPFWTGAFLIAVVIAAIYGFNRYEEHQRYEHINRFDYAPNPKIDYLYYDRALLQDYFENCKQLTDLGKTLWLRSGIDVTKTKTAFGESQSIINRYHALQQYNAVLESRLVESRDLKEQGLTDEVIEAVLNKGVTAGAIQEEKDKMAAYDFLKGKNVGKSASQAEIWEVQKLLNANDYPVVINGTFDRITDSSLVDFQTSNNLYPSHTCNDITLLKLAE